MAGGFFKSFDSELEVYSAGTKPSAQVLPKAVQVMREISIDTSNGHPKNVDQYVRQLFDYVITVCDHAKETCPLFLGNVKHNLHIGFEDPAEATGTDAEILAIFRHMRDEIQERFQRFYREYLIE